MADLNPFPLSGYLGPEFFCDREAETRRLAANALNGVQTTLISIRRMGKTALIRHVFDSLSKSRKTVCLYVGIQATTSQKDFLNQLSTAIIQSFPERKTLGRRIGEFISGLRPVFSYDHLTGLPEVSFDWQSPKQQEQSLQNLLRFLDSLETNILIAIDEFQQIQSYPEKNTEALLRSIIQPLKKVRFIFCGSSRHLLTQMFSDSGRPFYASSQLMELQPIDFEMYASFIKGHFQKHKKKIDKESIDFILNWTRRHTWFTQVLCNRLFAEGGAQITLPQVQLTCDTLLKEQEPIFFQYRTLLTTVQWETLTAIAKEGKLYQPGARGFLLKYRLGTPSTVKRSLDSLLEKEMIYKDRDEQGEHYQVYDSFLNRWLERS